MASWKLLLAGMTGKTLRLLCQRWQGIGVDLPIDTLLNVPRDRRLTEGQQDQQSS